MRLSHKRKKAKKQSQWRPIEREASKKDMLFRYRSDVFFIVSLGNK